MTYIPNATTEEHEEIEITPEMIEAGLRFLEQRGVSIEFAYPEFVAEFLRSTINGGFLRNSRASAPASLMSFRRAMS